MIDGSRLTPVVFRIMPTSCEVYSCLSILKNYESHTRSRFQVPGTLRLSTVLHATFKIFYIFAEYQFNAMSHTWILKDKVFTKYLGSDEIQTAVRSLANRISQDLQDTNPVFIVVLNGAFIFAADLLKKVKIDCEIAFVKLSSYNGMESSGEIQEVIGLQIPLKGRHVVIIEDIVDTGLTLHRFLQKVHEMEPADVRIAACLLKPDAFKMNFPIDYLCFSIPNEFVVGYGLDYDGLGRNSSEIYKIQNS